MELGGKWLELIKETIPSKASGGFLRIGGLREKVSRYREVLTQRLVLSESNTAGFELPSRKIVYVRVSRRSVQLAPRAGGRFHRSLPGSIW